LSDIIAFLLVASFNAKLTTTYPVRGSKVVSNEMVFGGILWNVPMYDQFHRPEKKCIFSNENRCTTASENFL